MPEIQLSEKDIKDITISIKKIVGQLQSVSTVIGNNQVTGQTFTQLLAAKVGVSKVCKDIISKGVLNQIDKYSITELDAALNIIFKLD